MSFLNVDIIVIRKKIECSVDQFVRFGSKKLSSVLVVCMEG